MATCQSSCDIPTLKCIPGPLDLDAVDDISRAPLSPMIAQSMRRAILAGDWALGARMPSEHALTARFEVGRSTIREALRVLQAQGLLTGGDSVSTARPVVSALTTRSTAVDALTSAVVLGSIPPDDLVDLRVTLEALVVERLAAIAPTQPDLLDPARRELEAMRLATVSVERFHTADVRFHLALAAAAGNQAVVLVMEVLREAIAGLLLASLRASPDPAPVLRRLRREHEVLVDAIAAGDADAAAALARGHIERFYAAKGRRR